MSRVDIRKRQQRRKRNIRKIQGLLLVVIFVFSMCKNMEILLEAKKTTKTISMIQYDMEEINWAQIEKKQTAIIQESIQDSFERQDFLTLLTQVEENAELPLLKEKEYVEWFYLEENSPVISETALEKLYRRDYALNYVSERQLQKKETDRETFYGLIGSVYTEEDFSNYYNFINQFYIVDASTRAIKSLFDGAELIQMDMTVEKNLTEPQILIYHTHSLEAFADSKPGEEEDTIVGVGNYLASLLTEKYGYQVLHDKSAYDINKYGYGDRDNAYQRATEGLETILEQYPSIEIMIDLHRDSREVSVVTIDGTEYAQIMLFNGLCRNVYGPYRNYTNDYLSENLALSIQMRLMGESLYPGIMRRVYLKSDQYNLHFRPHSLLVEVGTQDNTVEQAKNAMDVFADILNEVLTLK